MKSINHNWFLDLLERSVKNSGCLRRHYAAMLVNKNDKIIAIGTNNAPHGVKSCKETGFCIRDRLKIPRGKNYEICKSVHAEQEVIIAAGRADLEDAVLYLIGKEPDGSYVVDAEPCFICKKMIINAHISRVVVRTSENEYKVISVKSWIENGVIDSCIDTYAK